MTNTIRKVWLYQAFAWTKLSQSLASICFCLPAFQNQACHTPAANCLSSPLLSAIRQRYSKPLAIRHPIQVASHWSSHHCFHHGLFHRLRALGSAAHYLQRVLSSSRRFSQLDVARLVRTSVAISLEIGKSPWGSDMTSAMGLTAAHNITQSSHSLLLLVPLVPLVPGGG
eukprot:scaffold23929_cov30-Cyclotella_meneghiniana.AAC.1